MRVPSTALFSVVLVLSSCATFPSADRIASRLPDTLVLSLPEGAALRLRGSLEGPLGGFGPSMEFDAWWTASALRADLFYEEEGRPRHEVVLWTAESVLLFDRDRGGLTEIGQGSTLPAWGTQFSLESLHWLCLGRWPGQQATPAFHREGRDWDTAFGDLELSGRAVDRGGHLSRTALRWTEAGEARELSAVLEALQPLAGGQLPQRVRLDGDALELEVQLRISAQVVENAGDEVLNPLIDP